MHLFGPTDEERDSHPPLSTTATPFTFTFSRIQTSDSETAPFPSFLTLPGEIRNHIYLQVALDAPIIRLFESRVVLPPLASACRQIRNEMDGKYQKDATLNPATPVHALVTNFNFHSLSRWLNKHSRDLKDKLVAPRVLCITSVLLAPDATANCSTSNGLPKPKAVAFEPHQRQIHAM